MNILCVIGSRDIFSSNSSTMLINKTIFEGIKDLGFKADLLTLSELPDTQHNLVEYFDKVYSINCKNNISLKNSKKGTLGKILHFWRYTLRDVIVKPYQESELENLVKDKYDIILAFCPPSLSPILAKDVIKHSKLKKAKYIQYWSDPLTGSLFDYKGEIPKKRMIHKLMEYYLLRLADEIVYCTPTLFNMQRRIHPKVSTKMRWVDVAFTSKKNFDNKVGVPLNDTSKSKYVIGYFGAYPTSTRNIKPLINVMEEMHNSVLIIRGDTDIDKKDYLNIDIGYERIALEEIEYLENKCDVLICLGNIKGVQIPGKTFYYANYNKPVIFIADGYFKEDIKSYLSTFKRYILCENHEASIKNAINEAISIYSNFEVNSLERYYPKNVTKSILDTELNHFKMKESDNL